MATPLVKILELVFMWVDIEKREKWGADWILVQREPGEKGEAESPSC